MKSTSQRGGVVFLSFVGGIAGELQLSDIYNVENGLVCTPDHKMVQCQRINQDVGLEKFFDWNQYVHLY